MGAFPFQTPSIEELKAFCQRWNVIELSVFGSVPRGDATASSDVDILVSLRPGIQRDWDLWPSMQTELEQLFGRHVDLVERERLTNPFRRHEILRTRRVLYAA